jgi:hypothetical protein
MAIYPIWNPETGEKKVIDMSVHEIMDWYENNKPWVRDWSEGCCSQAELGEWKDRLNKKHPSWNEVLKKVDRAAGSQSRMNLGK